MTPIRDCCNVCRRIAAEVKGCIALEKGLLIIDDTTLDKSYASQMGLVTRRWSGKHHQLGVE